MNTILFLLLLIVTYIIYDFIRKNIYFSFKKKYVPHIKSFSLPLIGHIYLFSELPNRSVRALSEQYGGIFSMWIGDRYTIVVSDPFYINEFWGSRQFETYKNRPVFKTFEIFSQGYRNLSFSNNEVWRNIKRLVAGSFTKTKIKNYIPLVEYETEVFLNTMKDYATNNKPFYPKLTCHKYSLNIVSDLAYSRKICGEGIDDLSIFEEPKKIIFKKLGASLVEDSMFIQKFFYRWSMKEYEDSFKNIREYLVNIYDQHVDTLDENNPKDIMDLLIIGTNYNQVEVTSTMFDFLIAGSDTVGVSVEWFLLYMANNKYIQETAYKEIIDELGSDCKFVSYSDKIKTPYVFACVREVSRIKPTTSLGLPRVSSEDSYINGLGGESYFIPKDTLIIQNIYGMGTSKRYLDDPEIYRPERWIEYNKLKELKNQLNEKEDSEKDHSNESHNYFNDLDKISIPFGSGPRQCIASNMGLMELYVLCANILLNYKIESWDGRHINETEDFGITIHPKPHQIKLTQRN